MGAVIKYGVATARRGWLEAKDVVNTRGVGGNDEDDKRVNLSIQRNIIPTTLPFFHYLGNRIPF